MDTLLSVRHGLETGLTRRASRRGFLRAAAATGLAAAAVSTLGRSGAAASTLDNAPEIGLAAGNVAMQAAKNVLLVHGAWADGSSWRRVIPLLEAAGYQILAAQLSMTSLDDDVATTRSALTRLHGPTVVVGHSIGGAVITNAAAGVANVASLVYIAAFAPDAGEAVADLNNRFQPPAGIQAIAPDARGYLWIDRDGFRQAFAQDLAPAKAQEMAAVQRPLFAPYFGSATATPAWRSLPSWYMVAAEDRMINPDLERWMAQRIGAQTVAVPASHAVLVSHPADVVKLIVAAARQRAPRLNRSADGSSRAEVCRWTEAPHCSAIVPAGGSLRSPQSPPARTGHCHVGAGRSHPRFSLVTSCHCVTSMTSDAADNRPRYPRARTSPYGWIPSGSAYFTCKPSSLSYRPGRRRRRSCRRHHQRHGRLGLDRPPAARERSRT